MAALTIAVLPGAQRAQLEGRLPEWVEARFFDTAEELLALAPEAEIGWLDWFEDGTATLCEAIRRAGNLRWLVTIGAGLDYLPLDLLIERGVTITKGSGLSAGPIAEYTMMGMLALAKRFPAVLRAQDRREWLPDSPGKRQLAGSRTLVIGFGAIGRELTRRLRAFDVAVTPVSRSGADGALKAHEWQARLGEFDWVVLCAPATEDAAHMIGVAELAAMKREAVLINIARGNLVDQVALIAALAEGRIAGAMLDVTDPEPLPAESPLWAMDNVLVTMHLSGRSQDTVNIRMAERFLANLDSYRAGRPPEPVYDPARGY